MINKPLFTLLLILISVLFAGGAVAQTTAGAVINFNVQGICLMATNGAPVNLTLSSTIAGTALPTVSNSDMYVKISSTVPGQGTGRKITVKVSSGTVPPGTRLTLLAALSTNTNGSGRFGYIIATPIILDAIDHDLIRGIGSCYTGTGYTDGYRMTFTWGPYNPVTDYQLIQSTETPTTLTIMLTISAPDGNNN